MYLTNKYTKWYESIITNSQLRVNQTGYFEKHHIIPKSLGGSNDPSNLVKLTPKEHYICHLLLTKMVTGDAQIKMWYGHYMMMKGIKRYKPSARMYQLAKYHLREANKKRPGPNLGKKLSPEQRQKLSIAHKGKSLGPMSEEHKQKLRVPKSEEHKKALSLARLGKSWGHKHTEETKSKMSAWQKGVPKPKIICQYCNKSVSDLNYRRWHGDKCKLYVNMV
jgi:hypothetical protein